MGIRKKHILGIFWGLCGINLMACPGTLHNINTGDNSEFEIIELTPTCELADIGTPYSLGVNFGVSIAVKALNDTSDAQRRKIFLTVKSTSGQHLYSGNVPVYVPANNTGPLRSYMKQTSQITKEENKSEVTLIFSASADNSMSEQCTVSH